MTAGSSFAIALLTFFAISDERARAVHQQIELHNQRLSAVDRKVKYTKMREAPLGFFRGTNHLFWRDNAGRPEKTEYSSQKTRIWLHGDLHVENYGSFHDSTDTVVYDFNDFDDSLIADYQYDLWRMATSIMLMLRQNGDLSVVDERRVVAEFARAYLTKLYSFCGNDEELEFQITRKNAFGKLDEFLKGIEKERSRREMIESWTQGFPPRFNLKKDRLTALTADEQVSIQSAMRDYAQRHKQVARPASFFQVKDAARRLFAGTGSLGSTRFYVLIEGRTVSHLDDRILDIKEQGKPSAHRFLNAAEQSAFAVAFKNDAQRHAEAFRALIRNADSLQGWVMIGGLPCSVRERSPYKGTFKTTSLTTLNRATRLAQQWAMIAAANHARSDRDLDKGSLDYAFEDEVRRLTLNRQSAFAAALVLKAVAYADQVDADYRAWRRGGRP